MGEFRNIDERLDNWGMTVRSPKFQDGVCAQWARLYVALRDGATAPASVTPVEQDGWLVEAAWSGMPNHVSKWVLKYTYVWGMTPAQVQTRMRKTHGAVLRGRRFDLVLAEAHAAISRRLVQLTAGRLIEGAQKKGCKPPAVVL